MPAHHGVNAGTARSDPHLDARQMFVTTTYGRNEALVTSTGYHFSSSRARVGPVPRIGEDSLAVLRDHLGYPDTKIEALRTAGVVQPP